MQKKTNESLEMDMTTYKKVKGTIDPKTPVKITGDKPSPTGSSSSPTTTTLSEDDINTQDTEVIKFLSNVKDSKTGEISKPFSISDKRYQMIRGIKPNKEIVMAVYCHDDISDDGENIIHPIEYFEENIAKPMKEVVSQTTNVSPEKGKFNDKEGFMDYLNLVGLEGYKHFFVNIKTGEVTSKFKSTKDMIKSGIKLGPDEDYMDGKSLKRKRFGDYFKNNMNEEDVTAVDATSGTDVPKLQADVAKLVDQIKKRFSVYLSKLDKPIEQAQFLTTMAKEIGVPLNKLNTIITQFKDIAVDSAAIPPTGFANERVIMTKNKLIESIQTKQVIKTIKVKDIK